MALRTACGGFGVSFPFPLGIRDRQLHPLVHCADTLCISCLAEVTNQILHALTIHWVQALLAPTDASSNRQADATVLPCTIEPRNRRRARVAPKGEVTSISVSLNPLKLRYGHIMLNQRNFVNRESQKVVISLACFGQLDGVNADRDLRFVTMPITRHTLSEGECLCVNRARFQP